MNEDIKIVICFVCFFVYMAVLGLILDYILKREAIRQFYKDMIRLIILYENNSQDVFNREMPKILGTRIVRYSTYEKIMHDILFVYNSGSSGFHCALAYALSLHKSYYFSNRDLIKFKNKLLKEKTK